MAKKTADTADLSPVQPEPTQEPPLSSGPGRFSCCIPSLGGMPVELEAASASEAELQFRSMVFGLDPQAVVSVARLN